MNIFKMCLFDAFLIVWRDISKIGLYPGKMYRLIGTGFPIMDLGGRQTVLDW